MFNLTGADGAVNYKVDSERSAAGQPVGSSARAGLASFLSFVRRLGVPAVLAAGCRSARDGDLVLVGDRAAITSDA
jgi:hypothetical protein